MARLVLAVLALCALLPACAGLDNGLARRPFMGFNTWNYFACNINQTVIRQTIDAVAQHGLQELGYDYVNIDDCWQASERDASGRLQPHPERFPDGIQPLVEYAHARGLKLGIYSDAGYLTCARYPGSLGHEQQDAQLWASWGVDLLKYDNCYAPDLNVRGRYTIMRDALLATGAPILFSLCSWGWGRPWQWGQSVGNSWRIDGDIQPTTQDILRSLDAAVGLSKYAGPGGWNDPDMLEVGNGDLPLGLQRSHFALWALLKSPLLIGTDLTRVSADSLAILKAREVIAINQDELGVAGDLVQHQGQLQVWAAPLHDGSRAVVLFNRQQPRAGGDTPSNITVLWRSIGLAADVEVKVRDLYAERDLVTATGSLTAPVRPLDCTVLRLTPVLPSSTPASVSSTAPSVSSSSAAATSATAAATADLSAAAAAADAWRPWHSPLQQQLQAALEARERQAEAQQATLWWQQLASGGSGGGGRLQGQLVRSRGGAQVAVKPVFMALPPGEDVGGVAGVEVTQR